PGRGRTTRETRRLILTASGGPFREWPAERIQQATRLPRRARPQRLEDRRVLAVDRDQLRAVLPGDPAQDRPGHDQALLVRQAQAAAAPRRLEDGREPGGPGDRREDRVAGLIGDEGPGAVGPAQDLDPGAGQLA